MVADLTRVLPVGAKEVFLHGEQVAGQFEERQFPDLVRIGMQVGMQPEQLAGVQRAGPRHHTVNDNGGRMVAPDAAHHLQRLSDIVQGFASSRNAAPSIQRVVIMVPRR